MSQLSSHLSSFRQGLASKRGKLIAILSMTGEWKHLRTESQEFDSVFMIPSEHLGNILDVGQTYFFQISLATLHGSRLSLVRPVLGGMFGL